MTIQEAIAWQETFKKTYAGFPKEADVACDMAIEALKMWEQEAKKEKPDTTKGI